MDQAAAPGTRRVEILAATTRRPGTEVEMFSGVRGDGLSFADIVVSIPPTHQTGKVELPHEVPGNPATDFVTLKPTGRIDESEALAKLHQLVKTKPKRQVLVFVHGYNNRFEDSVLRFAQMVHDYKAEDAVVPILFSWPSKANPLAYGFDRESSDFSRDALEYGLGLLAKDPEVGGITVFAHSMGNWVTLEALRQMSIRDGRVARKIHDVILAAPDVDVDVARKQVNAMGPPSLRPRFTLFASADDRALAFSQRLHFDRRLGAVDSNQEPWKSTLRSEGIYAFNLTEEGAGDFFRHTKVAEVPQVVALVGSVILSRQTLTDAKVSPGEALTGVTVGVAAVAGHAVGAVLSAPIAVLDPETREHYGNQVEAVDNQLGAVGQSLQDAASPQ